MTLNYSFQQINLRERRLQFIRNYCDAFDVEPTFALCLFEEAVLELEAPSGVEPICNVEGDRLFPNQSDTYQSNLDKVSLISMAAGITR